MNALRIGVSVTHDKISAHDTLASTKYVARECSSGQHLSILASCTTPLLIDFRFFCNSICRTLLASWLNHLDINAWPARGCHQRVLCSPRSHREAWETFLAIVVGDGVAAGGVAGIDIVAGAAGAIAGLHGVLHTRASHAVSDGRDGVVGAGRRRLRLPRACGTVSIQSDQHIHCPVRLTRDDPRQCSIRWMWAPMAFVTQTQLADAHKPLSCTLSMSTPCLDAELVFPACSPEEASNTPGTYGKDCCRAHNAVHQNASGKVHGKMEHACCGRGSGSVVVVVHCSTLLRAIVVVVYCPVLRTVHVVVDGARLLGWLRWGEAHQIGVVCCCITQHTTVSFSITSALYQKAEGKVCEQEV